MMIKRYLFIIQLSILVSIQSCDNSRGSNSSNKLNIVKNKNFTFEDSEREYLNRFFIESLKNNNKKRMNVFGIEHGKKKALKSLLKGKKKLIIEYSPLSCNLCVDSLFTYINKSKLNKDLIIVTGAKNKNQINLELNKYSLNASVLMINITPELLEESNYDPKIYFLDKDMIISHYISINKSMVKYLNIYLKVLEDRL